MVRIASVVALFLWGFVKCEAMHPTSAAINVRDTQLLFNLESSNIRRDHLSRHLSDVPFTQKPSPTPRKETRVLGVGLGVFLLILFGVVCSLLWFDIHNGNLLGPITYFYKKPCNSCVCCLCWVGAVFVYLAAAPRKDAGKQVISDYSENFTYRYWILAMFIVVLVFLWIPYFGDFGTTELVVTPPDFDTEKGRSSVLKRSSV